MEYSKAIDILGLPEQYTETQLRKNYHLRALQFHPDKCSGDEAERAEATEKFREVQEAYKYLTDTWSPPHRDPTGKGYTHTLIDCLGLFNIAIDLKQARRLITMLEDKCHSMSLQVLQDMSFETTIELYRFLLQHQSKLGISTNMLLKIEGVLQEKTEKNNVVVVHAQIDNLMNQEMYILKGADGDDYVPLWHPVTHVKRAGGDTIVLCMPVLPANVALDERNDVHVNVRLQLSKLLDASQFDVSIGQKILTIPMSKLRVMRHQQIVLYEQGIPRPNADAGKQGPASDIIIHMECE